jgi:hypothetical protein
MGRKAATYVVVDFEARSVVQFATREEAEEEIARINLEGPESSPSAKVIRGEIVDYRLSIVDRNPTKRGRKPRAASPNPPARTDAPKKVGRPRKVAADDKQTANTNGQAQP